MRKGADVFAVVISFYDQRSAGPLRRLIRSVSEFEPGLDHRVVVVVNQGSGRANRVPTIDGAPDRPAQHWDEHPRMGRRLARRPDAKGFLFLQDDCVVVRDGWLRAFDEAADRCLSLVGESSNENWGRPWDERLTTNAGRRRRLRR